MADNVEPPPPYAKTPPPGHQQARNGIPPAARRSMEDESRPVPEGWVRQYDPKHGHQYFVDTKTSPPRSIWHHPFDDDQYLSTLSSEERERIQDMYRTPTHADIEAEDTDDEDHYDPRKPLHGAPPGAAAGSSLPPRPAEKPTLGRKMKDKLTGSTHQDREMRRRQRAEQERKMYEQHQAFRIAMARAMETGEPQLMGKDHNGQNVYIEPPQGPGGRQMAGYPGVGVNHRSYSPYAAGVYADPNARFYRPQSAYGRPYGMGYGGGYGMPLAGGLMGGMLMGGLLGGALLI